MKKERKRVKREEKMMMKLKQDDMVFQVMLLMQAADRALAGV